MNKSFSPLLIITALSSSLLLSGCDYFKKKKDENNTALAEWSCTNQSNIDQIQKFLKDEYLRQVSDNIANSGYEADQALLQKINNGLKFEVKNVRTLSNDSTKTNQLECESQLVVQFPKGLQQRAENAYAEYGQDCRSEECEGEGYRTLREYIEAGESKLVLGNDQLKGKFNYNVVKTDQDGLTLDVLNQDAIIQGVSFVSVKAVQYAAYIKENKDIRERQQENQIENAAQTELAQKAMDIRKKELDEEKAKQVDRLNQTWDSLTEEAKTQLKQDQAEWFEKRDIDCKVISQKTYSELPESEVETYQQQRQYWDDAMSQQNKEMQYTKCFNKRTAERIIYLNNALN
ncbi:DUF1311 domain-containing protein [Acinetobacter bereziniae]|uniref:lysozyme inhibitor LprI family protein n=1 Tax=Acinetobacter bereziniae TaxID=106648 RepID=UPI0015809E31|nr:lysozyme inhibitor LprI family protein [Acinetobacter bereziniae]NUF62862.1 DUF1311 domain-containing protein [Acinetobacter bereziniae]NUG07633.1 DUF1311 domain-containing protein [Acinetobacter bereziniae]NUG63860.1 DUF1311 domain-containing protein [Acinetobacter bereziniae]NUG69592.1 DUF1311 domain-containing protein [Acinetobacter bereziniae]NUG80948.1 DUF1311 domain-containing protein [Acinetobacter bereziniae]